MLAFIVMAVFLAMIIYGGFIRKIEVTRTQPDATEKTETLKGFEVMSKARDERLIRQDGRIIEKPFVATVKDQGTDAGATGNTVPSNSSPKKSEPRCPT